MIGLIFGEISISKIYIKKKLLKKKSKYLIIEFNKKNIFKKIKILMQYLLVNWNKKFLY